MPGTTQPLTDLRTRLLALHKMLLDDQRRTYEATYGRVASGGELLRLVLQHEDFTWLRALSAIISRIDETLEETEHPVSDTDVTTFVDEIRALLRSGGTSFFDTKYRDALQRSPEIVMAHAAVMKLL